jgi:hypothetical protein
MKTNFQTIFLWLVSCFMPTSKVEHYK